MAIRSPDFTQSEAPLDPLWYKDAVIYEAHVRSFYDSNADGIGDFQGLLQKLDYLQFLGITLIWLLPFYPSPLKDDGYDIKDFMDVNPAYGTLSDFKLFLKEAHRRNIRVMTELVLNHTSNEHPWFQKSRAAPPNSRWRNFYIWSDSTERYQDARIIFKDFENSNWTWDPVANAYYWHRFYSHQPDLNYDNPETVRAVFRTIDFWFNLGVDGLRLDAIPYLYKRDNTTCENLPETHDFLKKIRQHVDKHFKNRFLLAEANQWPEDAVAYFGDGDECHMAFHFPMMPRMYIAIRQEDSFPLIDILQQTPPIPDNCQWASFLRNHDELTLEMVTEEERDFMYRVYGEDPQMRINLGIRRRLAPLLHSDRKKIELMNGLLFSLPGTPVIYYGDEIGMGDNIYLGDRNGVRTPMQWNADHNAGFSQATAQKLYLPTIVDLEYNYEIVNVNLQRSNPQSLLWWTKRLIELRKQYKAFSRGSIEFLSIDNRKVFAFLRIYENESLLVVANLSRFVQFVELDLTAYKGKVPIELFGGTEFPVINQSPYMLTLGPHAFLYFQLTVSNTEIPQRKVYQPPQLWIKKQWLELLHHPVSSPLLRVLPDYLYHCRWFKSKMEKITQVRIMDQIELMRKPFLTYLLIIQVEYKEAESEQYLLPIASTQEPPKTNNSSAIIAQLQKFNDETEWLMDALYIPEVCHHLFSLCKKQRVYKGKAGKLLAKSLPQSHQLLREVIDISQIKPIANEQSNTSINFANTCILKLFRRMEAGINPDVEINRYLSQKEKFTQTAVLAATIEYHWRNHTATLGHIQQYIPHQTDAWNYTLDAIGLFFESALSQIQNITANLTLPNYLVHDPDTRIPDHVYEDLGAYAHSAHLLGIRTAELHLTLGSETHDPYFLPEPFTLFDQKALHQSIHYSCRRVFEKLAKKVHTYEDRLKNDVLSLLDKQQDILAAAKQIVKQRIDGKKIRCHGDYHLGQILYTGQDFVLIDFEGEPERSLTERQIKRSSLRDVAGLLRSLHYAISKIVLEKTRMVSSEEQAWVERLADYWYRWSCQLFLRGYREKAEQSHLLPKDPEGFYTLLRSFLIERAAYEIDYELNNRSNLIHIPCRGMLNLMDADYG